MKRSKKRRYKKIGCATRGGDASRATENRAIALAREHDAEMVFLYVVDTSFAHGLTGKFGIDMVEQDLREIGRVILEQARERAREQGVNVRSEMREGRVADEIQHFVERHKDLDLLVVGHMSDELRERLEPVLQRLAEHRLEVLVVRAE